MDTNRDRVICVESRLQRRRSSWLRANIRLHQLDSDQHRHTNANSVKERYPAHSPSHSDLDPACWTEDKLQSERQQIYKKVANVIKLNDFHCVAFVLVHTHTNILCCMEDALCFSPPCHTFSTCWIQFDSVWTLFLIWLDKYYKMQQITNNDFVLPFVETIKCRKRIKKKVIFFSVHIVVVIGRYQKIRWLLLSWKLIRSHISCSLINISRNEMVCGYVWCVWLCMLDIGVVTGCLVPIVHLLHFGIFEFEEKQQMKKQ